MLVYLHGNCQARAIAQMLAPMFPDWTIKYYEVFQEKILEEIEQYYSIVRNADIIVSQPIRPGYRERDDLSLEWVRSAAKPQTPIITFPSMYFGGQLIGWTSLSIPGIGMDYHNVLVMRLVLSGLNVDDIVRITLSPDLYDESFIANEIELSIDEIRRREKLDSIDVSFSPFLERFGMSLPLFHIINHPCRPALAYVANKVLAKLGYPSCVSETGEDHIQYPHVPCSPSVMNFFAGNRRDVPEWQIADGGRYHFHNEHIDPANYITRACLHLRTYPSDVLQSCIDDHRAKPFLTRAEAALPNLTVPAPIKDRSFPASVEGHN